MIYCVEDERNIRELLIYTLETTGFKARGVGNGNELMKALKEEIPELILLDIMLPGDDGYTILEQLKSMPSVKDVPVIMVTSRTSEVDEVLSMSYGADDFITKPYNPTVLLLRIQNIFKRMEVKTDNVKYNNLNVELSRGIIKSETKQVVLTKNEMIIFALLLNNKGRIVSRDQLMTDLWNNEEYINDNALTVNISRLRNKLASLGCADAIETRKGQGYILL